MDRLKLFILSSLLLFCVGFAAPKVANNNNNKPIAKDQEYVAKNFSYLLGMTGLSDKLLNMHFTLYNGYVKNTNLLIGLLKKIRKEDYAYQALKRRLAFEFDGMRLHELYFENLGGKGKLEPTIPLAQKIVADFGSLDDWRADFTATGMLRGIGWAILYLDPQENRLINVWIADHDLGHLAGGIPLLVMDVWEHAYLPQYDLDRAGYIKTFFESINWDVVSKRYE